MSTNSKFRLRLGAAGLITLSLLVLLISSLTIANNPPTSAQADDTNNCQTFSETGFKVCGRFLQYWQQNGGLTQQGYPISDAFNEKNADPPAGDGKVHLVQYFQRARFELHPENQPPYDVLLGLLGNEQYGATPTARPTATPTIVPTLGPTPTPVPASSCLPVFPHDVQALVQACVDKPNPTASSEVTVYARLIYHGKTPGGIYYFTTWHLYDGQQQYCNTTTDNYGLGSCTLNIGNQPAGFKVWIEIHLVYLNITYGGAASFTVS